MHGYSRAQRGPQRVGANQVAAMDDGLRTFGRRVAYGALEGVDMFGGKRGVDPFERSLEQRPQAWMLFGRLGVINYQNQLDRDSGGEITLKRSGPSVGGTRISFGIRRRF